MNADAASAEQGAPTTASGSADRENIRRQISTPSCNLCRKRKVKCDRGNPCLPCQRTGVECEYPTPSRLPRGRQGGRRKKDTELLQRIAKLENLVKDLESDDTPDRKPSDADSTDPNRSVEAPAPSEDSRWTRASQADIDFQTLSSKEDESAPFWIALSDEINGLRYLLGNQSLDGEDDDELDDQYDTPSSDSLSQNPFNEHAWVLCGPGGLKIANGALQHPPRAQVVELCEVYLTNVHSVCNILHGPSLKRWLRGESPTLDCSPGIRGLDALRFSVFHAAAVSLTDAQCIDCIGAPRNQLLVNFRRGVEAALVRADFINTVDMSTLQALIIFIVSVRSYDKSRFAWTLIGIAVRIAQALGIHSNSCYAGFPLFQAEMRRRLWWMLCITDSGLAMDRGSELMILKGSFNTHLPMHINDSDIWLGGPERVSERNEFTDMTFTCMCGELYLAYRDLNYVLPDDRGGVQIGSEQAWERRKELARTTQRRVQQRYLQYCDQSQVLQWIVKMVANHIVATLWLTIYRPLVQETIVVPPDDRPNVLVLAVELLEKHAVFYDNPAAKQIAWLSANYVQWHPLAIILAELCVQTEGPLVDRAWKIVDYYYDKVARDIADTTRGMRWQPIRKLMSKAKKARQAALQQRRDTTMQATETGTFDFNQFEFSPAASTATIGLQTPATMPFSQPISQTPEMASVSSLPQEAFNWDPWLLANTDTSIPYNAVTAWRNWETFIDDFQGESLMPGLDYTQPQDFSGP
ncbi:MAG: hypothetical protein M1822_004806 [Bathelium mastoideum]|nr:MAG: hypothetical protein M1822_004806 [Bathelium mastoideum]